MAKTRTTKKPSPTKAPPLRLEYRKPSELAANPANWRRHPEAQLTALADVIAEVGWAGVLLYNETMGRLIDGHARKSIAEKSDEPVPVVIGSWTEAQERTILATLDPLAAMAEADSAALASLLADVETSSSAVAAMLDELRLNANLANQAPVPGGGGDEFDATPEAQGPTRTQPGGLWAIGGTHRLLVGDCTVPENVARLMGGKKAELCFTSPPYNLADSVGLRNGHLASARSAYVGAMDDSVSDWATMMESFTRITLAHCSYLVVTVQMLAANKCALAEWLGRWANHLADVYVWVKTNPQPAMAERVATSAFEFLFVLSAEANPTRAIATASFPRGEFGNVYQSGVGTGDGANVGETRHGAVFPLAFAEHYVGSLSGAGDTVLDPFLGSGTTLVAAHRLGRACYGCELEPRYADVILKRAEAEGLDCAKV